MTTCITVSPQDMPLQSLFRWETERANEIYLTQPRGAGVIEDITWSQAADQVRRMATWLTTQGWPAGSRVAILEIGRAHV